MKTSETMAQKWHSRLELDYPESSPNMRESVVRWLLGPNPERFDTLERDKLAIAEQAQNFLYRILQQRYWGVNPDRAYRNLLQRLASSTILRQKIKTWVSLSRDRQQTVIEVLQEALQEMLQSDRHLQGQITWISQCTDDPRLANTLLLANLEEYCLRPIRNQPLIIYRFVNYLRRIGRGGMTQVPTNEWIRLVSEEFSIEDSDDTISLLDNQALAEYNEHQDWEAQQILRQEVQEEFANYLKNEVDPLAATWLRLYLQGNSQESISQKLNIPVKQLYRIREKVNYHALRVFAVKQAPELVGNWLETSLKEHSLGLTPTQWETFWQKLNPIQQKIVEKLKGGNTLEAIALEMKIKPSQILGEWTKIYKMAQDIRNSTS